MAFLTGVEQADPNSPVISEDDTNKSWGHHLFSRSLTVLESWKSIGNTDMACQLITAAIKISKVAQHISSSRQIIPSTYLSNIYLAHIIEMIWASWKEVVNKANQVSLTSLTYMYY
jgi:hypothetical protein